MKLSLNWLREWVAFDEAPADLATRLTLAGLESEVLPQGDTHLAGVVVGQITAAVPHPQADRLQVCTVDIGRAAALSIVCGASNARVGFGPAIGYAYSGEVWRLHNESSSFLLDCALTPAQVRIVSLMTVRHWKAAYPWSAQAKTAG